MQELRQVGERGLQVFLVVCFIIFGFFLTLPQFLANVLNICQFT